MRITETKNQSCFRPKLLIATSESAYFEAHKHFVVETKKQIYNGRSMSVGERAHNKTMAAMRVQASFVPTHPTTSTQSELSFCRRAETRPLARLLMHEKGLCWRGLGINKRAIAARWQKEHCVMEHTHTQTRPFCLSLHQVMTDRAICWIREVNFKGLATHMKVPRLIPPT
jgi:hypothetical protein